MPRGSAIEGQRAGWARDRSGGPRGGSDGSRGAMSPALRRITPDDDYQRFGATISRSIRSRRARRASRGGLDDGRDLDRFSRYAFGTFDNRLRGYPSALIRYDRGGVLRGAAWAADGSCGWTVCRHRLVHDPGFGPGFGELHRHRRPLRSARAVRHARRGRMGLRFQGECQGPLGTQVIRISGYKVF